MMRTLGLMVSLLVAFGTPGWAQEAFPTRAITIVNPFPPTARLGA